VRQRAAQAAVGDREREDPRDEHQADGAEGDPSGHARRHGGERRGATQEDPAQAGRGGRAPDDRGEEQEAVVLTGVPRGAHVRQPVEGERHGEHRGGEREDQRESREQPAACAAEDEQDGQPRDQRDDRAARVRHAEDADEHHAGGEGGEAHEGPLPRVVPRHEGEGDAEDHEERQAVGVAHGRTQPRRQGGVVEVEHARDRHAGQGLPPEGVQRHDGGEHEAAERRTAQRARQARPDGEPDARRDDVGQPAVDLQPRLVRGDRPQERQGGPRREGEEERQPRGAQPRGPRADTRPRRRPCRPRGARRRPGRLQPGGVARAYGARREGADGAEQQQQPGRGRRAPGGGLRGRGTRASAPGARAASAAGAGWGVMAAIGRGRR
jgi:hypothetical protein